MFRGQSISKLVALLLERRVSLFHACQYRDFQTYLTIGGIPSRALVEQEQGAITPFETDARDKANGVWDKVFLNLEDFGRAFARGRQAVPNPFGPIALQIHPRALLAAEDVAICPRSAGAYDFDRESEALPSVLDVDNLFRYPASTGFPRSTYIKYGTQLASDYPRASSPEISCSYADSFLALEHLIVIWVDPYRFRGRPLAQWVANLAGEHDVAIDIHERPCSSEREDLYGEILSRLRTGTARLNRWRVSTNASGALTAWAQQILDADLGYQFRRFATYLRTGTMQPLRDKANVSGN